MMLTSASTKTTSTSASPGFPRQSSPEDALTPVTPTVLFVDLKSTQAICSAMAQEMAKLKRLMIKPSPNSALPDHLLATSLCHPMGHYLNEELENSGEKIGKMPEHSKSSKPENVLSHCKDDLKKLEEESKVLGACEQLFRRALEAPLAGYKCAASLCDMVRREGILDALALSLIHAPLLDTPATVADTEDNVVNLSYKGNVSSSLPSILSACGIDQNEGETENSDKQTVEAACAYISQKNGRTFGSDDEVSDR
ncbi:unnamed protein product [Protopolystoma xenopodis]|uniref:Uncharacterized protein n=1 Tax=Protopolystoma xenopodis TaxID=117903 RepID=A0A3S5A8X7_9PLAT|nr:unnamed protein product [Protopolystoma xenopodis]